MRRRDLACRIRHLYCNEHRRMYQCRRIGLRCRAQIRIGIASRSASCLRAWRRLIIGTRVLICILTLPFAAATILSPIPYLFLVGLQTPLYTVGMIFLLRENNKVLLDLHRSEHANRQMAHHDLLTGLPNRAMNLETVRRAARASCSGRRVAAREVRRVLSRPRRLQGRQRRTGHATGDAVLVAVAERLRASIRDVDSACRLGGDEFVVLLPDVTDDEAISVARRIISRVSEPFDFAPNARIGVSIGIAAAPRDGLTADELLSAADRAMYEAKRRGKGGFVISRPERGRRDPGSICGCRSRGCRAAREDCRRKLTDLPDRQSRALPVRAYPGGKICVHFVAACLKAVAKAAL